MAKDQARPSLAAQVGARLEEALADRSVTWLAETLSGCGVERSGYSSVYRYVKGQVEPSLTWLREAAGVLDVPFAWLATGLKESLSKGEQPSEGESGYSAMIRRFDRTMTARFPPYDSLPWQLQATLARPWESRVRLLAAAEEGGLGLDEAAQTDEAVDLANRIADALRRTFHVFGHDPEILNEDQALNASFHTAMAHALGVVADASPFSERVGRVGRVLAREIEDGSQAGAGSPTDAAEGESTTEEGS